eukprot:5128487-Prymnesium_polylepis.1
MWVGQLAEALGYGGETYDTRQNPSYEELNRTEIIRRLSDTPQHWLTSASQPMGKLYGAMSKGDDDTLTEVGRCGRRRRAD